MSSTKVATKAVARPTKVVDGGPHPNLRKAAEGYRLRVLAVDDAAAEVVRRIFVNVSEGDLNTYKPRVGQ